MWFTEKRHTHHTRKGTHATMKTAKAIEETLRENLEEISKTSDGHAYYSTPLNTKDPSAKKSVLTKVSVQKRKTPV